MSVLTKTEWIQDFKAWAVDSLGIHTRAFNDNVYTGRDSELRLRGQGCLVLTLDLAQIFDKTPRFLLFISVNNTISYRESQTSTSWEAKLVTTEKAINQACRSSPAPKKRKRTLLEEDPWESENEESKLEEFEFATMNNRSLVSFEFADLPFTLNDRANVESLGATLVLVSLSCIYGLFSQGSWIELGPCLFLTTSNNWR